MQASNGWVIATIILVGIAVLIGCFLMVPEIPEPPVIPTAQEIASLIVIPNIEIPTANTQQQKEIWEEVYKTQIDELKSDALAACEDEFDWESIEDLFDTYATVEFVEEFEDDREFTILNLGLDDEDDRSIVIEGVIKVEIDNDYKDLVYGKCIVTSDDGDLEADLSYHL